VRASADHRHDQHTTKDHCGDASKRIRPVLEREPNSNPPVGEILEAADADKGRAGRCVAIKQQVVAEQAERCLEGLARTLAEAFMRRSKYFRNCTCSMCGLARWTMKSMWRTERKSRSSGRSSTW